jgi:muconolactone delta-isomerase
MAKIETILKRIEGKEKALDKLNKKLARIRKVESQNWEDPNPYCYSEYDLKRCLKDIELEQKMLDDYRAQLVAATEKANSRNVQVILEFLEMWKTRVREYYTFGVNSLKAYYTEKENLKTLRSRIPEEYWFNDKTPEQIAYTEAHNVFWKKCHGYYEKRMAPNWNGKLVEREVKVHDGEYEWLAPYTNEETLEDALARLEADLVEEANQKYDFIIERTNHIVGTITDASNLKIGAKGDLNGFIIGDRGTAKVQTIGAGGYNIQCFHFRTLINEMK